MRTRSSPWLRIATRSAPLDIQGKLLPPRPMRYAIVAFERGDDTFARAIASAVVRALRGPHVGRQDHQRALGAV